MEKCGVCLNEFPVENGETMPCHHRFCQSCIYQWFKCKYKHLGSARQSNLSCPICRQPVKIAMTRRNTKLLGLKLGECQDQDQVSDQDQETNYIESPHIITMSTDNEIDYLLYQLEHPQTPRSITRSKSKTLRKILTIEQIRQYFKLQDATQGIEDKLRVTNDIFMVIYHQKFLMKGSKGFGESVENKLREFYMNSNPLVSNFAKKWHYTLFNRQISTN